MTQDVDDWLDSLGESGTFETVRVFGELTMYMAARAFLGNDFGKELGSQYYDLLGFSAGPHRCLG